jgi:hypothetical protein
MKTVLNIVGRTLILLAAALVVVGVLVAIDRVAPQTGFEREGRSFPSERLSSGAGQDFSTSGQPFPEERRHDEHGESGLGLFSLATLFKNLFLMSLAGGVVWLGNKVVRAKAHHAHHT